MIEGGHQVRRFREEQPYHGRIKVASLIRISENTMMQYFKLVNTKKLT